MFHQRYFLFSPLNCHDSDKKYYFQITITFPNSIKGKFGQFKSRWPHCVALTWSEDATWDWRHVTRQTAENIYDK